MGFALGLGGGGAINAPTDISLTSASTTDALAIGGTIGVFSATDADVGETFTFELIADVSELFDVSGTNLISTGALTVGSHTIVARVTDSSGATFDETFVITVVSANLAPTDIALAAIPAVATTTTWNPSDKSANIDLTNGNLTATRGAASSGTHALVRSTLGRSTGKWVFAVRPVVGAGNLFWRIGLADASANLALALGAGTGGVSWTGFGGTVVRNGTTLTAAEAYSTTNTELMVAVDLDARLVWFRADNGNWNNNASYNPATGVGGYDISALTGTLYPGFSDSQPTGQGIANFGASNFVNDLPQGFKAWNGAGAAAATGLGVYDTVAAGTAVFNITGTDPDTGESLTLTFSEQADPSSKFTVTGGQVLLSAALTAGVSYSLTIRATDVHGATYDEIFSILGINASVRVTQAFAEVIYDRPPTIRVSQAFTEVPYLDSVAAAKVRVTQAFTEVIYS